MPAANGRPTWEPTAEDRAKVINITAQGSSVAMTALSVGVSEKTLRKHCGDELAEGRAYDCQHSLNVVRDIGNQKVNYPAALRASTWRLATLHGYVEPNQPVQDNISDEALAEVRDAELEQLDRKLEPYLLHQASPPGDAPATASVMAEMMEIDHDPVTFSGPGLNDEPAHAEPHASEPPNVATSAPLSAPVPSPAPFIPEPQPTAAVPAATEPKPSLSDKIVRARKLLED
jgi:hypothetical protein